MKAPPTAWFFSSTLVGARRPGRSAWHYRRWFLRGRGGKKLPASSGGWKIPPTIQSRSRPMLPARTVLAPGPWLGNADEKLGVGKEEGLLSLLNNAQARKMSCMSINLIKIIVIIALISFGSTIWYSIFHIGHRNFWLKLWESATLGDNPASISSRLLSKKMFSHAGKLPQKFQCCASRREAPGYLKGQGPARIIRPGLSWFFAPWLRARPAYNHKSTLGSHARRLSLTLQRLNSLAGFLLMKNSSVRLSNDFAYHE